MGFPRRGDRREQVTRWIDSLCGSNVLNEADGREVIRRLLRRIYVLSLEYGAELMFVLLPDGDELTNWEFHHHPRFPKYLFFRNLLRELPYTVLDLREAFAHSDLCEPASDGMFRCPLDLLFLDGSHFTAYGHRRVLKTRVPPNGGQEGRPGLPVQEDPLGG